ncbi:MAG: RagB/SusD family nutrient uptake outer membrane protein [Bacteroidetes bacterium]|nr:RagB/SusD family nutrient uptake outer membrane protein [Bacteroidota bacterium]
MKKILYIIVMIAVSGFLFSSCNKLIEKDPAKKISDQTALSTVDGVNAALIGTYNSMTNGFLYGGNIWVCGDMLANNITPSGDGNIVYEETQMLEKGMSPDNLLTASFWQQAYYTINITNSVLQAAPLVSSDKTFNDYIIGNCEFIRAMVYFDLIRYLGNTTEGTAAFGLGVPLLTAPSAITDRPARATIEQVYTQIIKDLVDAATRLGETDANELATRYAAQGLLSRVYFYHGDWALAEAAATVVIESGKFGLDTNLMAPFSTTAKPSKIETVFALQSTTDVTAGSTLYNYYAKANNGKFMPSGNIINMFVFTGGNNDKRFTTFFKNTDGKYSSMMFDDKYFNVPLIRLAEIYLNRAESRYNLLNNAGALADMNLIRERVGLNDTNTVNLTLLYRERSKELVFQGDNFFNMKRLKKTNISDKHLNWDSERLLYLVPQREMDVNKSLIQN